MRVALLSLAAILIAGPAAADARQDARQGFIDRCRDEILAANTAAADWVDQECDDRWVKVARSNPMVDAVLSLFQQGDPPALSQEEIRARAAMVTWPSLPGVADPFEGRFAGLGVLAEASPPRMTLAWSVRGEPVPYDVVGALRTRDADLDVIGCYGFGPSETTYVFYVVAPGHAPFALTVHSREAPTASAQSYYSVSAAADRIIPTLNDLRAAAPDLEWQGRCD